MNQLERPAVWYSRWMFGSDAAQFADRKRVFLELKEAIARRGYDAQTLQELMQLLDYEYLHLKATESQGYMQDVGDVETAIPILWISELFEQLSVCMSQLINGPPPLECELLSRVFLSALTLLRSQDAEKYHRMMRTCFDARLQEWRRMDLLEVLTTEKFHMTQCLFLLSIGIERTQYPGSVLPESIADLMRVIGSIMLCISTASVSDGIPLRFAIPGNHKTDVG